jgi:hypothetical protein
MTPNPLGWGTAFFFLVLGAVFAVVPGPQDAHILGLILIGVGVFLVLYYLWLVRRARSADDLRRSGTPGRAVIKAMTQTGVYVNNLPQVKFTFEVQPEGLPAYELVKRMVVPMISLGDLGVGKDLTVHVDPSDRDKIAIDW